jgi:hypothetical protein
MKAITITITAFAMFILTASTTPSFAQNKKDSSALDYSHPGRYHQILADLAGTWNFKGRHFSGNPNPDSNKVIIEFHGNLVRKPFANGRFFIVELTGDGKLQMPVQDGKMKEDNGRTIETEGYDNVKKKFVLTLIGNHVGSGIIFSEGSYDSTTKTISFESELELIPGMKIKVYEHFIILDNDNYRLEYYRERNGTTIKATEMICTRDK